jgi:hypothetical protein
MFVLSFLIFSLVIQIRLKNYRRGYSKKPAACPTSAHQAMGLAFQVSFQAPLWFCFIF